MTIVRNDTIDSKPLGKEGDLFSRIRVVMQESSPEEDDLE